MFLHQKLMEQCSQPIVITAMFTIIRGKLIISSDGRWRQDDAVRTHPQCCRRRCICFERTKVRSHAVRHAAQLSTQGVSPLLFEIIMFSAGCRAPPTSLQRAKRLTASVKVGTAPLCNQHSAAYLPPPFTLARCAARSTALS